MRSFSISDVSLCIECGLNGISKRVSDAIEDYVFMIRNGSITDSHSINLRFKSIDSPVEVPETANEITSTPFTRVLKEGDFRYLIRRNAITKLDLANSLGTGYIDSAFWEDTQKARQDFFVLTLLWLIHKHGLYGLHANGLVKDGTGVLFIGGSGSSKSTTALSLIRYGWSYLSDDINLLSEGTNGIEALAFQKGFFFNPDLADRYPELNKPMKISSLNGQKRFLDISSIYPDRFLPSCIPKVLIFPKIVSQDKSCLIPIDRTKALIMLIVNSIGIILDKKIAVKQMQVLKRLVYQTDGYQLLAGRDLYKEPEKISEVLSGVMNECFLGT